MEQSIVISIEFPATNYDLHISEVHVVNNELIVISSINSEGFGGQAFTVRSDSWTVDTNSETPLPIKHYALVSEQLTGRRSFETINREPVTVVPSIEAIPEYKVNRFAISLLDISDKEISSEAEFHPHSPRGCTSTCPHFSFFPQESQNQGLENLEKHEEKSKHLTYKS